MRVIRMIYVAAVLVALIGGPARAEGPGSISGIVTDLFGSPLERMCVDAGDPDRGLWYSALTGQDGTYVLNDVEPGVYTVGFYDCTDSPVYLVQWFDGADSYYDATPVEISDGQQVGGIDAALRAGGFLTGTLTDNHSTPASTCLTAYDDDFEPLLVSYSGDDGNYRIGPLPEGEVRIHFADCGGWPVAVKATRSSTASLHPVHTSSYVQEWYDDAGSFWEASPVPVIPMTDTPGIDAVLVPGASIQGRVTGEDGEGLDGMCVEASNAQASGWTQTYGETGAYMITQLPPGSYTVSFYDCRAGDYLGEYWDDHPYPEDADPVVLVEGGHATNVDAALELRPRPDMAVTGLKVSNVPLETDAATLPGIGWRRIVDVEVENVGRLAPQGDATLAVWVQMRTDGSRRTLTIEDFNLKPGEKKRWSLDWDGFGSVGDAEIHARVCTPDDPNWANDERTARTYALVGGTGVGFEIQPEEGWLATCRDIVGPEPTPTPVPLPQ
jgi:hypothetical protein